MIVGSQGVPRDSVAEQLAGRSQPAQTAMCRVTPVKRGGWFPVSVSRRREAMGWRGSRRDRLACYSSDQMASVIGVRIRTIALVNGKTHALSWRNLGNHCSPGSKMVCPLWVKPPC